MKPIDENLLNEIQPLDDAVLDELATAFTDAASTIHDLKSDWQPRRLETLLHALRDTVKSAQVALVQAAFRAEEARAKAGRCRECGRPFGHDADGFRWCANASCTYGQIASSRGLRLEFLAAPPTEEIRELCRAYWLQDEAGFFVYYSVSKIAKRFGYSVPKTTAIVRTHCRACTRSRCENCGEPIARYQSRSAYMHRQAPRATKCPRCARA